ncbi:MAG: ABC transporter substrate-binding protein [Psychroserpens sp.]|uniref:ABC transporter substrate-binding protein n=1 Tax=Psychroserpens sp. TaxID=2020870 RepID=UPI003C7144F4
MRYAIPIILILLCFSCKDDKGIEAALPSKINHSINSYAEGFAIQHNTHYSILTVSNPWPNSAKSYRYALIPKENAAKLTLNASDFDGMLLTPIQNIVVTSTTHVPALELLGVEQSLVGFPGTDYISSEKTRVRISDGKVRELGQNESINTEVLLELRPNLVIAFGVDGSNKALEIIEKSGIPVIYNGDWVEKSPLAKAEWIKFFGALYNKDQKANSIFNQISSDYLGAKKIAQQATSQPTILSGAMYKDVWYLPNGTSPEAQILKDANTNYLWSETTNTGSLALSFETVFDKAKSAQFWINPSNYGSYDELKRLNSHYTEFDAFQEKNIHTYANTVGKTGGVLYFELGTARPDLVLKDIIKICHPELLTNYETTFYKPLTNELN